jgi:hypothetical protein
MIPFFDFKALRSRDDEHVVTEHVKQDFVTPVARGFEGLELLHQLLLGGRTLLVIEEPRRASVTVTVLFSVVFEIDV